MTIRVGKVLVSSDVNGPGRRVVIWCQGCDFHCPGCFNPEFWDRTGGEPMTIDDLIAQIEAATDVEGITFTGGEPLLQAENLLPVAEWAQDHGLSVVCYTGFLLQEILDDVVPAAKQLLIHTDVLIDGRYAELAKAPLLWRGSRNQRVHFLTERYRHLAASILRDGTREVELQIGPNRITMTGIFDIELWGRLRERLSGESATEEEEKKGEL